MLAIQPKITDNNLRKKSISMKDRQAPLRQCYIEDPDMAWIVDSARTSSYAAPADEPLHGRVRIGSDFPAELTIGVHKAVGGESDYPNPGEVLCAAVACCLDSSIRIIANHMGVRLVRLEVSVDAMVDVRGTLCMDRDVPVGFQEIDVRVRVKGVEGTSQVMLEKVVRAGEQSCVLLQTLQNPPKIEVSRLPQVSECN